MKAYHVVLSLLLCCGMILPLAACGGQSGEAPSASIASAAFGQTESPTARAETELPPTESLSEEERIQKLIGTTVLPPDEIFVYPFTDEELSAALAVAMEKVEDYASETGILTFELERIAFDPILTDIHARQRFSFEPVSGWTEEDYFSHTIAFSFTYSATYDHTKTFYADVTHEVHLISLRRDAPDAPWEFYSNGVPVAQQSPQAMSAEEIAALAPEDGRILAAYHVADGYRTDAYWIYLCDDSTGTVTYLER